MGSFLPQSAPKYSPITYVPQQSTVQNQPVASASQTPVSGEEEAIKNIIKRNSKGQSALIQTSYRGVLTETNQLAPQRKNLLGE